MKLIKSFAAPVIFLVMTIFLLSNSYGHIKAGENFNGILLGLTGFFTFILGILLVFCIECFGSNCNITKKEKDKPE